MQTYNSYFTSGEFLAHWKKTSKKRYYVKARIACCGEHICNVLEGSNYITDREKCIVLKGTAGEEWVTSLQVLGRNYTMYDGKPISVGSFEKARGGWITVTPRVSSVKYYAMFLNIRKYTNVPIGTSWGDVLTANRSGVQHGYGDFLVCSSSSNGEPNFNDMWVVNGKVFLDTYNLKSFGGSTLQFERK